MQNLPYEANKAVASHPCTVCTATVFCVFSAAHLMVIKHCFGPKTGNFEDFISLSVAAH